MEKHFPCALQLPGSIFSVIMSCQLQANWGRLVTPPARLEQQTKGLVPYWTGHYALACKWQKPYLSILKSWNGSRMVHRTEGKTECNQVSAGTSGKGARVSPCPVSPCFSHWVGLLLSHCTKVPCTPQEMARVWHFMTRGKPALVWEILEENSKRPDWGLVLKEKVQVLQHKAGHITHV